MRLDTVESKKLSDLHEFPDIVHTTGTLPGTYTIKLELGAKGVIHSVTRQPAALKHLYGIRHKTSSPHLPRSNGGAERAVHTGKRLWLKATDRHLAQLNYRTTPLEGINLSPVQLLMGRRSRNTLPMARR